MQAHTTQTHRRVGTPRFKAEHAPTSGTKRPRPKHLRSPVPPPPPPPLLPDRGAAVLMAWQGR